ncbi:hypothetical protein GCM10009564_36120 [Streptomyces thermogriseus]|uniref:Uncharacterized protein n=1 Tax=Streptomyces thermogriseus TaxID=75292 RepID=A0ABP4DJT9_9ACTN
MRVLMPRSYGVPAPEAHARRTAVPAGVLRVLAGPHGRSPGPAGALPPAPPARAALPGPEGRKTPPGVLPRALGPARAGGF